MRHIRFDSQYLSYIFGADPTGDRTFADRVLGIIGVRRTECDGSPPEQPPILGHIPGELPGCPSRRLDEEDSGANWFAQSGR